MPNRIKTLDEEYLPSVKRRFFFDEAAVLETTKNKTETGQGAAAAKELFKAEQTPLEDFADVVDKDHGVVEQEALHSLVAAMLPSPVFRGLILFLIISNAIVIGIQTDETLSKEYHNLFSVFDQLVLTVFVAEICLKWYYGFFIFWKVGWNILDFVIVVALLLGPAFTYLGSSRILRILRVFRAARSLRSISGLQSLNLVVQTVLQSLPDMFNIALVLTIILVVFSVAGITLFGKDVPYYFGNLGEAMYSLFICITQDGWVDIVNTFKEAGESQPWIYQVGVIYLILVITVGSFVFANLAVAAVVTNLDIAMEKIKEEKKANDALNYVEDAEITHVPIVPMEEATYNFDFSTQKPIHAPDLKNLSLSKLENYFLILTALEENLAEYKAIREDLDKIFDVVCEMNVQEAQQPEDGKNTNKASRVSIRKDQSGISLSKMPLSDIRKMKGDILSNMMTLNDQWNTLSSSSSPRSLDDVIKSAAKKLT